MPDQDDEAAKSRDTRRWPKVRPTDRERLGHEAEERDDVERERLRLTGRWGPWPRDCDTDEPPRRTT